MIKQLSQAPVDRLLRSANRFNGELNPDLSTAVQKNFDAAEEKLGSRFISSIVRGVTDGINAVPDPAISKEGFLNLLLVTSQYAKDLANNSEHEIISGMEEKFKKLASHILLDPNCTRQLEHPDLETSAGIFQVGHILDLFDPLPANLLAELDLSKPVYPSLLVKTWSPEHFKNADDAALFVQEFAKLNNLIEDEAVAKKIDIILFNTLENNAEDTIKTMRQLSEQMEINPSFKLAFDCCVGIIERNIDAPIAYPIADCCKAVDKLLSERFFDDEYLSIKACLRSAGSAVKYSQIMVLGFGFAQKETELLGLAKGLTDKEMSEVVRLGASLKAELGEASYLALVDLVKIGSVSIKGCKEILLHATDDRGEQNLIELLKVDLVSSKFFTEVLKYGFSVTDAINLISIYSKDPGSDRYVGKNSNIDDLKFALKISAIEGRKLNSVILDIVRNVPTQYRDLYARVIDVDSDDSDSRILELRNTANLFRDSNLDISRAEANLSEILREGDLLSRYIIIQKAFGRPAVV